MTPYLPDPTIPLRPLTEEECRTSGFPTGTEVSEHITTEQLMESRPFLL